MEENPHLTTFRHPLDQKGSEATPFDKKGSEATPVGGLIRLRTHLTELSTWLGPAWAALCGALASGGSDWQGEEWLKLAVLVLLVDVGWGGLWAALGSSDWAATLVRWREWRSGDPVAALPYTLPGSPGDRISRWAGCVP